MEYFLNKKLYPAVGLYLAYCIYIVITESFRPGSNIYYGVASAVATFLFFIPSAMTTFFLWLAIVGKFPIGENDPVVFGDRSAENMPQKRRGFIFRSGYLLLALLMAFSFYAKFNEVDISLEENIRYMIIPGLIGVFAGVSGISIAKKNWDDVQKNKLHTEK